MRKLIYKFKGTAGEFLDSLEDQEYPEDKDNHKEDLD